VRVKNRKKKMRKIQLAIMGAALAGAMSANATLYNITFTENAAGPTTAIGTIDVVGGLAISGSLNVLGGPNSGSYPLLLPPGSDGSFTWDNLVNVAGNPSATPSYFPGDGLVFGNGGTAEVNLWYNAAGPNSWGPKSYALWGAPPNWSPVAFGDLTLTPVPEPTTMIAGALLLLPFGLSTIRILRRKA
jgi:hypothetical protein